MTEYAASTPRLKIALAATAVVAVVELLGGFRAGSLALLSDAAHVSMDVVALTIALAAAVQAKRPATHRQTYGFARYEILAALANGCLLSAVTVLIVIEAVHRLFEPVLPSGALMAAVAGFGLVVNVGIGIMLLRGHHGNLNMRAALLHVGGDALSAISVIVGGVLIAATGMARIDPILSLIVAAIIVAGMTVPGFIALKTSRRCRWRRARGDRRAARKCSGARGDTGRPHAHRPRRRGGRRPRPPRLDDRFGDARALRARRARRPQAERSQRDLTRDRHGGAG